LRAFLLWLADEVLGSHETIRHTFFVFPSLE